MHVLEIDGPVAAADVPLLCARLRALPSGGDAAVVVDVRTLAADAVTIEALARLQLTARRLGRRIRLRRASPDLDRLVSFAGLADVLPSCGDVGGEHHAAQGPRTTGALDPHA